MLITKETIAHYLLGRGLLSFDSVVDGDFLVVEATSRNRNFKVIRAASPGYFVKQVKTFEPQAVETMRYETACYWLSHNDPDFEPLAALMPKFYDSDPARHALVIELLPEGGSLSEYHRQLGSFPVGVGVQLGRILGTYQREMGRRLRDGAKSNAFARRVPWILSLHQMSRNLFGQLSAANTQVLNILQSYPDFPATLDRMSAAWRFDSLIHGDIKWDNLHVTVESGGEGDEEVAAGKMSLRLVDWELADFGDACWDAGAVFQSYLSFWVFSMPQMAGVPAEQLVGAAQFPVEKMQPAIRAFWKTYVETRGLGGEEARDALERSVSYGAARMIQTAYEYMFHAPQITTSALYLLQLSLNILKSPREAVASLLAL
ncbi:MAG TPA: phosphotransferase [Pyrinomonadaceae bacterium]|nr:phosphotransferase [Pyrinomonadaceae bacterium]